MPSKEVLDFAIAASKKLKGEAIPVAIDGLFFNAVNLKKFLEAVASKGMDKVVYRHPMLYATNDYNDAYSEYIGGSIGYCRQDGKRRFAQRAD